MDYRDPAIRHHKEAGMSSVAALHTFGTLQGQTPVLPGLPLPVPQPTQPHPSSATPVDYGPPLPSAAPSGPATSAALFLSPLQQTH